MKINARAWLIAVALTLPAKATTAPTGDYHVLTSPDDRIRLSIQMPAPQSAERPSWSATFQGKPILTDCRLGLQTAAAGELMAGARPVLVRRRSISERVRVLFGRTDWAEDRFREAR